MWQGHKHEIVNFRIWNIHPASKNIVDRAYSSLGTSKTDTRHSVWYIFRSLYQYIFPFELQENLCHPLFRVYIIRLILNSTTGFCILSMVDVFIGIALRRICLTIHHCLIIWLVSQDATSKYEKKGTVCFIILSVLVSKFFDHKFSDKLYDNCSHTMIWNVL